MEQLGNFGGSLKGATWGPFTPEKIGYIFLALTAFLLPFFFIPSTSFVVEVSKILLLTVGLIVTLFFFLLNTVKRGELVFPQNKLILGVFLVPITFLASALLGTNPSLSLFGYALETGTWAFVALGFLMLFLVSVLFRTREKIFYSYVGFFVGSAIIVLMGLSKLFWGGEVLSFGVLNGVVANLIGAWTDLAVFLGVGVMLAVIALETMPLEKMAKAFLYGLLVLSLFILAVLDFSTVWILLLIFSLVFFVYLASSQNKEISLEGEMLSSERRISYPSLAIIIISILFFFNPGISGGQRFGTMLAERFGVSNSEIRPSLSSTRTVAEATLGQNPLFGSGPNTFDTEWLMHKPAGINETNFWNVGFPSGSGLLTTFIVTSGLLGVLAWVIFLGFYLHLGLKAIFAPASDRFSKFLITASFLASLFLWVMTILYVPSTTVFALAFFFSGLFVASTVTEGVVPFRTIAFGHNAKLSFLAILLLISLLVGSVVFAYNALAREISTSYFQKALIASNEENGISTSIAYLNRAISLFETNDVYYRALAQAHVLRINQALANSKLTEEERKNIFQESLQASITAAQTATNVGANHYQNWMSLGGIYESLVPAPFSIEGSYDNAKAAYLTALKNNPESPEIYLMLARLEGLNNNIAGAKDYTIKSIEKKNNYADAYFFLTQIELQNNNLKEAIKSSEATAILSPNNAGVFFQLGLLKYNDRDFTGAVGALLRAVTLVPDYSNAKYFLGLSLEELDQHDAAIAQFQDLAKTNPENAEVIQILSNLQAGKAPFTNIPSAVTDVKTRQNPPIVESESSDAR
jgi:cytochrome c-type biogenesis protein CcmH/NrfG